MYFFLNDGYFREVNTVTDLTSKNALQRKQWRWASNVELIAAAEGPS